MEIRLIKPKIWERMGGRTMSYISKKCAGRCPICDSVNIKYGDSLFERSYIGFKATCYACGAEVIEWYSLVYEHTTSGTEVER